MKWIYSLGLLSVLVVGSVYVMGSYQIVRTDEGYEFVEKKSFKLGKVVVDTRDWGPTEWFTNRELLADVTRKKFKHVEKKVSENWSSFSGKLEKQIDDLKLDKKSKKVEKQLEALRHKTKQKFEQLDRQREKKEITWEGFTERMEELKKWTENEIREIKKRDP